MNKNNTNLYADISIEEIRNIQAYFKKVENQPDIQQASSMTAYLWQNMSRNQRCAMVLRDGQISELSINIKQGIGEIMYTHKSQGIQTVNEHFDCYPMDAMVIVQEGVIVHEAYKTMRPFDKHNWFSCGKTIVSILIGLLVDEGKINLEDVVTDYLAELSQSVWESVRVQDILDMTTGLDSTEHDDILDDSRTNPDRGWFQWAVSMGIFPNDNNQQSVVSEVLRKMKRTKPAGEVFEYNSINTWVLEMMVEQVSGKPLAEFLSEKIWRNIGAQADAYVSVNPDGYPMSFGFMSSTLRDFARYGLMFSPSWNKVSSQKIVPDDYIRRLQVSGNLERYAKGFIGKEMLGMLDESAITNSNQWDAVFSDGDFYKQGVGGQGLYVSPSRDLVIAWFCTGGNDELTMARAIALSSEINQRTR
ncbi:hypothetical protein X560_0890 [Listeria fleischmannii 1991]|uniref:6-aminohexanoate-dimer hydrolase n=2 Tax=Listeria fleischmannii TaxID=1069827 RepID=A0A2X3H768_9LIST|nr:serine hydrolase [Listeria fleischmannii]EMG27154.1 beta-lactamase [Listeria fleischmannii subsp. fleischmannii LU2006-1]KMT60278.1 hypothetical protein X560_0890 [Listeria fleischmannii 1991]SQC70386.1 6-aminohexanoate-dimer hydrolase [Listeria fleischmannii subsp. fleischmannii]